MSARAREIELDPGPLLCVTHNAPVIVVIAMLRLVLGTRLGCPFAGDRRLGDDHVFADHDDNKGECGRTQGQAKKVFPHRNLQMSSVDIVSLQCENTTLYVFVTGKYEVFS